MTDVKLSQDMTDSERAAARDALRATEKGLEAARDVLTRREPFATDPAEVDLIRIQKEELVKKIEDVRRERRLLREGTLSLRPPPPEVVEDLKRRAAALDGLVAKTTAAKTVVDSAALLVSALNGSLRP